jgi:hypothetical protein
MAAAAPSPTGTRARLLGGDPSRPACIEGRLSSTLTGSPGKGKWPDRPTPVGHRRHFHRRNRGEAGPRDGGPQDRPPSQDDSPLGSHQPRWRPSGDSAANDLSSSNLVAAFAPKPHRWRDGSDVCAVRSNCAAHAESPPCRRKTSARSRRPFCSIWSAGVRPSLSLALVSAPWAMRSSMIWAPCCVSLYG